MPFEVEGALKERVYHGRKFDVEEGKGDGVACTATVLHRSQHQ